MAAFPDNDDLLNAAVMCLSFIVTLGGQEKRAALAKLPVRVALAPFAALQVVPGCTDSLSVRASRSRSILHMLGLAHDRVSVAIPIPFESAGSGGEVVKAAAAPASQRMDGTTPSKHAAPKRRVWFASAVDTEKGNKVLFVFDPFTVKYDLPSPFDFILD